MVHSHSGRARAGRFSPVELAIAFALAASVLAVAVPAFTRELHASRLVEPVEGLRRLGGAAIAYGQAHAAASATVFPPSAPMTPSTPPRGQCAPDPPGTWDQPAWAALGFRPVADGAPHCFAFAFDSTPAPAATFRAHAHGDLDGDGITSTFEVTGRVRASDGVPVLDPGMYVDSEDE